MQSGYIAIETLCERSEIVRLLTFDEAPEPQADGHSERRLRYIARFNDRDAALMHTHEVLKRRLIDLDTHLYRVPLEHAIAAAESVNLKYQRVFLDPELSDESLQAIESFADKFRARNQAWSAFFQILGYIGVGLLLLNMFLLSFH